ncbi:hypothetical protein AB0D49_34340 [Streptomyces sp. NPDC048290]|uniref:hypothetical protein n=1 Tax=Streptomyces sp. NPDC048290 TaxID=3155811 RepID=UPI003433DBF6
MTPFSATTLAAVFNPESARLGDAKGTGLLGILAYSASIAGIIGLLTVGLTMALQLRRGEPGEGGEHFRGLFLVGLASLVATTAGPLVAFLGDLSLLGDPPPLSKP